MRKVFKGFYYLFIALFIENGGKKCFSDDKADETFRKKNQGVSFRCTGVAVANAVYKNTHFHSHKNTQVELYLRMEKQMGWNNRGLHINIYPSITCNCAKNLFFFHLSVAFSLHPSRLWFFGAYADSFPVQIRVATCFWYVASWRRSV